MSAVQSEAMINQSSVDEKSAWIRPDYAKLKVAEAENQDGSGTESSGFLS